MCSDHFAAECYDSIHLLPQLGIPLAGRRKRLKPGSVLTIFKHTGPPSVHDGILEKRPRTELLDDVVGDAHDTGRTAAAADMDVQPPVHPSSDQSNASLPQDRGVRTATVVRSTSDIGC